VNADSLKVTITGLPCPVPSESTFDAAVATLVQSTPPKKKRSDNKVSKNKEGDEDSDSGRLTRSATKTITVSQDKEVSIPLSPISETNHRQKRQAPKWDKNKKRGPDDDDIDTLFYSKEIAEENLKKSRSAKK
jgi:hypothetical protein